MILYLVSGAEGAGKTALCRRLVGAANVWDLGALYPPDHLLERLRTLRTIAAPRCALDGVPSIEVVSAIRRALPTDQVMHFHIVDNLSSKEPSLEMLELGLSADYAISFRRIDE